ncbi:hypothetical protein RFI_13002 [Reticulomyxa filosa]|uniref:Uncharacterized protein n=1 Tax=Reticulomyxa filosa TaxID=46433 RepID=X6NEH5_RETFI|nr:hypothetical protein RFI_13002 [Reticulomyxa filosa]|eukprot:ETO24159.1 hypothetical protein RFI_13002 [Reticulomyxa filosa]
MNMSQTNTTIIMTYLKKAQVILHIVDTNIPKQKMKKRLTIDKKTKRQRKADNERNQLKNKEWKSSCFCVFFLFQKLFHLRIFFGIENKK